MRSTPRALLLDSRPSLRFTRFLIVGASGLVINNLCLVLFTELGGIYYLASAVMATQCSTLWNFAFTEIWVFPKRGSHTLTARLLRFFLMNNAALLLRGPLLTLMVSVQGIHYLIANLVSLFMIAVIRFILSDRWIWTATPNKGRNGVFAYDIHNLIGIESRIRLPELEYFLIPELGRSPDIHICRERRNGPRTSIQTISYNDGFGRFGFDLSIDRGETTEITVSPLVERSPHVLYTNVLEPVLRWTFLQKGFALVHGACVILGDKSALITAQTDTGKTSTILRILESHRCSFISDDMTILGSDGRLLNFPKPLTISSHTLSTLRDTTLQFRERLMLQIQSRIHSRSGRRLAFWLARSGFPVASINAIVQILIPPPKFAVDRLIPEANIVESASLSHVVQIERGSELQEEIEPEDMVEILLQNAEDAYGFPPYPELADSLSTWRGQDLQPLERQIVRSALSTCQAWRLASLDYGWWRDLPVIVKFDRAAVHSSKDNKDQRAGHLTRQQTP